MSGLFAQQNPWGVSPQPGQGIGSTFSGPLQPQAFAPLPIGNVTPVPGSGYGTPWAQPPVQQLVHSLLVVPQQLQQLLQLAQIQQYQVQYLLQAIPQQLQQLQQQLAFYPQSFAPPHALGVPQSPFGGPQPFGGQPGYLM